MRLWWASSVLAAVVVAAPNVALTTGNVVVSPTVAIAATCAPPAPPAVAPADLPPSGFHSIAPIRLLDTRGSGALVGDGCTVVVDVGTTIDIPSTAQALALNVTAVDAARPGYITVYPCGSGRPDSSNVNPRVADTTANSVLVALDSTRQVCLFTLTAVHMIVDVTGWFGRYGAPFHGVDSTRLLDTRTTLRPDGRAGLLPAQTELRLPIVGGVISTDARAAAVNVTVADAEAPGFITAYPCSSSRPATSAVNFLPGQERSNHVVLGLDVDGSLCLWSNVAANIIVDVEGWFGGPFGSGSLFQPLLGTRVVDTRTGIGGPSGKVGAESTLSFDPSASARLPIGSTVVFNVIATEADARGYIAAYPCNSSKPATSAVNSTVGTEATNVAFVAVDASGNVCLFVSQPMHVVVDVIGTFGPGGPLRGLTVFERDLGQTFTPDGHDYTMRCSAGANSTTVHVEGALGTTVSVARSTDPAPQAVSRVVDAVLSLREDEAFVVRAGAPGATPQQYWVRCLPHDFPVLQTTTVQQPNPGWYLMDAAFPPADTTPPSRFAMILDSRSVPVWYHRVAAASIDLTRLSDGTLAWTKLLGMAFGSTPGGAFEIHALDGTLLRTVSTVSGPTDHHDIAELPNGDIVLATYVPRAHVDLRVLGPGYGSDELVYDGHLEEIRPDGSVAWTWKSEDHIPISATTYPQRFPGIAGLGVDLIHINSIHVAPDGDLVVSARHTDTVYKVRRNATGDIALRIGGNQSDLAFVNDPLGGFARQHDAQILANGDLRLFDNRTGLGPPRAVEYALDLNRGTATLVWSISNPAVTASGGVGSVRSIGDGDTVVAWGGSSQPAFVEYDADGNVLQSTSLLGRYPYRVDKQPTGAFDINQLRATSGL